MRAVIVLITLIGIAAVVGAVYMGVQSFDGVVVEHPYERGLAWDRDQHLKKELGWHIELMQQNFKRGMNQVSFRVLDKNDSPLKDMRVMLRVSRPSTEQYDRVYRDMPAQNGWFSADVDLPLQGMWGLVFSVERDGQAVELEKKVYAEKR